LIHHGPGRVHRQVERRRIHRTFVTDLLLIYVLALLLPAIDIDFDKWLPSDCEHPREYWNLQGYQCLCFIIHPWWLPNPLFGIGLICLAKEKCSAAFACGLAATSLALTVSLLVPAYYADLAQVREEIIGLRFPLRSGYFVWMVSMVGLTAGGYAQLATNSETTERRRR
jgi:hypothetical protein